ncbi:MAG: hypothetical protein BWZ10_03303 [candidate division BRC1 bacterium ADurb.BinA364]|nr:MAG: hypothetical protein BWZ10_03303 [candidate division BRC1 bacterium ADurb.BinA364]
MPSNVTSKLRISCESSKSTGLGAGDPLGMTLRRSISVLWIAFSCKSPLNFPVSTSVNPSERLRPYSLYSWGFFKSASISSVFKPRWAMEIAKLLETVVFPSPGRALVIKMVFGGCPASEYWSDVRRERTCSANADFGS